MTHQKPTGVPPPQCNLQTAIDKAVAELAGQTAEQLQWLGAQEDGPLWRLDVLASPLRVDLSDGQVTGLDGNAISPMWRVLVLHYLAARVRPEAIVPAMTFASLPDGRAYASVYQGRVIGRLCGTVGRDADTLQAAVETLAAIPVDIEPLAWDFNVFSRLTLRLVYHPGDDEFPASATLLMPANIEQFLCIEDIVVLSERLVSRLSGKPF